MTASVMPPAHPAGMEPVPLAGRVLVSFHERIDPRCERPRGRAFGHPGRLATGRPRPVRRSRPGFPRAGLAAAWPVRSRGDREPGSPGARWSLDLHRSDREQAGTGRSTPPDTAALGDERRGFEGRARSVPGPGGPRAGRAAVSGGAAGSRRPTSRWKLARQAPGLGGRASDQAFGTCAHRSCLAPSSPVGCGEGPSR